jgi:hypothetical protein
VYGSSSDGQHTSSLAAAVEHRAQLVWPPCRDFGRGTKLREGQGGLLAPTSFRRGEGCRETKKPRRVLCVWPGTGSEVHRWATADGGGAGERHAYGRTPRGRSWADLDQARRMASSSLNGSLEAPEKRNRFSRVNLKKQITRSRGGGRTKYGREKRC